jgi:uncharacterized protein (TIGR02284 family)
MNYRYTILTLSELLAVNRDGERGFSLYAEHARRDSLKRAFMRRAVRRAAAAAELRELIAQLGADPMQAKIPGASQRGWARVRSTVALNDDDALVDECEHGEDHALEVYRNALDDHLPDFIRQLVLRQFEDMMSDHDQIRFLRSDTPQGVAAASIGGHARQ